jgi:hypothetical protein
VTEQLTGYEASSVAEIGAILDGSPADADQVYLDTIAYSERAIAAVAAKRAGGGGGGGGSSVAVATLTNAQVLALPTTPIQVVAAPGANKLLLFTNAFLRLVWAADYSNIDASVSLSLNLNTNTAAILSGSNDVGGLLSFGENGNAFMWPNARVSGAADLVTGVVGAMVFGVGGFDDEPQMVNKPFSLEVNNSGLGNFTGGDVANELQIYVVYSVLTLV